MPASKVTVAARIRPGDHVLHDDTTDEVRAVRRAPGRKPAVGENLVITTASGTELKLNSTTPVRVHRSA